MFPDEAARLKRIERMLVFLIERQDKVEYELNEVYRTSQDAEACRAGYRTWSDRFTNDEDYRRGAEIWGRMRHEDWIRDLYWAGLPLIGRRFRKGDIDEERGVDLEA